MSNLGKQDDLPVMIIGSGGHACVVADALNVSGCSIVGFTDSQIAVGTNILVGLSVLGNDNILSDYKADSLNVAIGVGFMPGNNTRFEIFHRLKKEGFFIKSVIHPSSVIGSQVTIQEGAQIMAGAILQPRAVIGVNVIVNTGARIDHDSIIGDHSHIAPGVTVCGGVTIGKNCFVGAGATIIHGIDVGDNVVIAAGATVYNDILPGQVYTKREKSV